MGESRCLKLMKRSKVGIGRWKRNAVARMTARAGGVTLVCYTIDYMGMGVGALRESERVSERERERVCVCVRNVYISRYLGKGTEVKQDRWCKNRGLRCTTGEEEAG